MKKLREMYNANGGFLVLLAIVFLLGCLANTLLKVPGNTDGFQRLYAFIPAVLLLVLKLCGVGFGSEKE